MLKFWTILKKIFFYLKSLKFWTNFEKIFFILKLKNIKILDKF